jgi:Protein of unknown function (DUF664)
MLKHLATWEARYFGEVFGRPFPEPLPAWNDTTAEGGDFWATEDEARKDIVGFYQRVWEHADATIDVLDIDAPDHVPWWPRPDSSCSTSWFTCSPRPAATLDTRTSCVNNLTAR